MSEALFVHKIQCTKYLYSDLPGFLFGQSAIIVKVLAQITMAAILCSNEKRAWSFVPTIELDEGIYLLCDMRRVLSMFHPT